MTLQRHVTTRKVMTVYCVPSARKEVISEFAVSEYSCETIRMKMCSAYEFRLKFCTRTRFETEPQGNSEMAY